jgi:hypothetical protein
MANVGWGTLEPLNFNAIDLGRYLFLTPSDRAARYHAGDLRALGLPDHQVEFFGTGFVYDAAGQLVSGVITAVEESVNDQLLGRFRELSVMVEQFRALAAPGQSQAALAFLLAGDDRIAASPFADYAVGYGGNDFMDMGSGDDVAFGGPGNDVIVARSGTDTVLLSGAAADYQLVIWGDNVAPLPRSGGALAADGVDKLIAAERLSFLASGETLEIGADNFAPLNYIAGYDDLIQVFGANSTAGFDHYIYAGAFEGRGVRFSGFEYLASYDDLLAAFGPSGDEAAAAHYITSGRAEGRAVLFDGLAYVASYRDLIRDLGADDDAGAAHYLAIGRDAGRSVRFDPLQYTAGYDDLIVAFRLDRDAASTHFIQRGLAERRSPDRFDAEQYLDNYADLRAAFGDDENAATIHYITSGYDEGRTDDALRGSRAAEDFLL